MTCPRPRLLLLIQQIFTEHLLYAGHCARSMGDGREQKKAEVPVGWRLCASAEAAQPAVGRAQIWAPGL